ncbi:MAG TPA: heavy metal-binding domain-containing protein [Prolixibacteraceae bacterium]|nr:heavy metal-binding domain-containing protein [Prolixibacteraceae bacterium]
MKSKFLFSVILVAGLMLLNFSDSQVYGQTPQKKTAAVQTVKYTCPMHTQIIKDKPGKCPICGMKLVVKKELSNDTMQQMNDSMMMMKNDHMKMMHDSTSMKKGAMMHDTNLMNGGGMMNNTKMMHKGSMMPDTTMMKKGQMMHDTTSMQMNRMKKK